MVIQDVNIRSWVRNIQGHFKKFIESVYNENLYINFKGFFFCIKTNSFGGKFIYLKHGGVEKRGNETGKEISSICWFASKMPTTARARPGTASGQDPRT